MDYTEFFKYCEKKFKASTPLSYNEANKICSSVKSFVRYLRDHKDEYYKIGEFDVVLPEFKYLREYIFDKDDSYGPKAKEVIKSAIDKTFALSINEDIILYRGLKLKSYKDINLDNPGTCWTFDENTAKNFIDEVLDEKEGNGYIISGNCSRDNIDWISSICLNINHNMEHELRVYDQNKISCLYFYPYIKNI